MADINQAARVLEDEARRFEANGARAVEVQARPSGDDLDVIKVWIDLGPTSVDPHDWAAACEAALAKSPAAAGFRIQVRAEKL